MKGPAKEYDEGGMPSRGDQKKFPPALVISLDFELCWGLLKDRRRLQRYKKGILGAREVIPQLLDMFEAFSVAATWATVGCLFAESRDEFDRFAPEIKPRYPRSSFSPFSEPLGDREEDDPFHFAGSLIREIQAHPRQEIGSHTFSHHFCLEKGQDASSFRSDIQSACAIAQEKGVKIRSFVFPGNQVNPLYEPILTSHGIVCFRGNPKGWMHRRGRSGEKILKALRFLDSHVNLTGHHTSAWESLTPAGSGPVEIRGSFFLWPHKPSRRFLDGLRQKRIMNAMTHAAASSEIVHLHWHPHNFGTYPHPNLEMLRKLLTHFRKLHHEFGMVSLTMEEVCWMSKRVLQNRTESRA